jgi:dUTP pyrophosphatase
MTWLNMPMNIKLLHERAKMPSYAHDGDSGADCYAIKRVSLDPHQTVKVPLGFAIELPPGFEAQIRPRSSLSAGGIWCAFGTIDCSYRGELAAVITNTRVWGQFDIEPGHRICQLVIAPVQRAAFIQARELGTSVRGSDGFGSTGR